MVQVIDDYKASKEYHDTLVEYGQGSFNARHEIRFQNCRHLVAARLPEIDLFLLDEDEGDVEATEEAAPPSSTEEAAPPSSTIVE